MRSDRGNWQENPIRALSLSPQVGQYKHGCVLTEMPDSGTCMRESLNSLNEPNSITRYKMGMDITWVTDRIAVGGGIWNAENMAAVSRAGITHIIDMQIEFDDTALAQGYGIEVCWNPVDDDFEPKPVAIFARGVEFALVALNQDGTKLFVHCAAGVHRAPMMTLAILGTMGWALDDARDLIEKKRASADFAEVYVRSVENFLKKRESRLAR
jgi:protein-tyrosine phosphatase